MALGDNDPCVGYRREPPSAVPRGFAIRSVGGPWTTLRVIHRPGAPLRRTLCDVVRAGGYRASC